MSTHTNCPGYDLAHSTDETRAARATATELPHAEASAHERRLELAGYEAHLQREAAAVEVLQRIQAASVALRRAAEELEALGAAYLASKGAR